MAPPTRSSVLVEKEAKAAKDSRAGSKSSSSATPRKTKRSSAKKILTAAAKIDFSNSSEAQEWGIRYKEKLNSKSGNQILHVLASKDDWPDDTLWEDHQIKHFLDWTLKRHHGLLEIKDDNQYTPLHLAIINHNDAFVDAVLRNTDLVNLGAVLLETCQYGNSLHVAIRYRLPSIELMIDKCAQFNQIFTQGQANNENTPLHSCMSLDLDEDGGDDDEDGSESGAEDDSDDEEYDDDRQSHSNQSCDGDSYGLSPVDLRDTKKHGWATPVANGTGVAHRPPQRTKSFLIPPIQESTKQCEKVVNLLIEKYDSVLSEPNKDKRTPYQERVYRLLEKNEPILRKANSKTDREKSERDIIARDPIASYIRSYCVRKKNFPRDKIMKALYNPGHERHIEFDLGGLPHASISKDYLEGLSKHLQFESILKYVALPKLTIESDTIRQIRRRDRPQMRGLNHLEIVFDWLRGNGVEKVVKVMVIDDADPSHSDTSIEKALRNLGVEIWDWKRLDLSTDVIWRATSTPSSENASVVREISLYSTGNNSVLMGWASPQGLTNRKKFPHLKKVNLFIREGLEDRARRDEYIKEFKETIMIGTAGEVEVNHILDNKQISYASEFKNSEASLQSENPWIECMSSFASLLRKAEAYDDIQAVKIAIIDDGVDGSLSSLENTIAIGKSFCPYANSTELMSPYYVPSGNHGTCMATLISKICPKVKLYVARLDERQPPGSSHRQITARSAADVSRSPSLASVTVQFSNEVGQARSLTMLTGRNKAILWATESGVDIISMSWTIETPIIGNDDMQDLKTAVEAAKSKGILMFCSTSDQGRSTSDNCFPGDFDGCIKIGGATETGEALTWVNADKVHFLLPGINVPFTSNEGKIISYESGSSVATAAASGLAGLIMFSGWLLDKDDNELQKNENMREAFKKLSLDKFLRVQEYFDRRFKMALLRDDTADDSARKPKASNARYNLQHMSWDANCVAALTWLVNLLKEKP